YSGPAINVLAIILTARILGWQMGLARAVGAVVFAFVVGGLMAIIFRKDELKREQAAYAVMPEMESDGRKGWQELSYFLTMVLILIFAAWGKPKESVGFWNAVYDVHWYLTGFFLLVLIVMLVRWFQRDELRDWVGSTWGFSKQILPLLFAGVIAAGFLMGRPESQAGIIPSKYISAIVGGNSISSNFIASIVGALMYFATLTEVPILQGLLGSGMGQGPALALLLAGPALSLPKLK
ncbi:MAG: permease, partial [Candidatus Poribacteria bacterium]